MQYRTDPRSGNELSALGFGCMRFPRKGASIDIMATERLIMRAIELGVNYFDTAYSYAGSEEVLGDIIARNDIRDSMFIASKLPHGRCRSIDDVERLFTTSLQRLQTDHIDYYLIHNIVNAAEWQRLVELGIEQWVADKKESGAIRQIGFSFHGSISEYKKVLAAYDWDFVQIQYNYMNERYQAGRDGLELAASRGLPVIIMEPLLGGKLATGLPENAMKAFDYIAPGRTPAQWGLRWLWDQPEVGVVLSGMNAPEQLEENCAVASNTTPRCMDIDELAAIEVVREEFGKYYKVPCTGCNYCMPCPQNISIPSFFAAYNESFSINWRTGAFQYLLSNGAGSAHVNLASDCIECGACVKKCPQHIDIPTEMKNVKRRLQPPLMGSLLKAYAKLKD